MRQPPSARPTVPNGVCGPHATRRRRGLEHLRSIWENLRRLEPISEAYDQTGQSICNRWSTNPPALWSPHKQLRGVPGVVGNAIGQHEGKEQTARHTKIRPGCLALTHLSRGPLRRKPQPSSHPIIFMFLAKPETTSLLRCF